LQLSNEEIIERYLVPPHEFVQRGVTDALGAAAEAFSRKEEKFQNKQKLTELDANPELAELRKKMVRARTEEEAERIVTHFLTPTT
jgi:hypothetical protein